MNTYNSHDSVVLVAPRPVRLAAPFSQLAPSFLHRPQSSKAAAVRFVSAPTEAFERLKLAADAFPSEEDLVSAAERDRPMSPRTSPLYVYRVSRTPPDVSIGFVNLTSFDSRSVLVRVLTRDISD